MQCERRTWLEQCDLAFDLFNYSLGHRFASLLLGRIEHLPCRTVRRK